MLYTVETAFFPVERAIRLLVTRDEAGKSHEKIICNAKNQRHPTFYTRYGEFIRNNKLTSDDCTRDVLATFPSEVEANEYFNDMFDYYASSEVTLLNDHKRRIR